MAASVLSQIIVRFTCDALSVIQLSYYNLSSVMIFVCALTTGMFTDIRASKLYCHNTMR